MLFYAKFVQMFSSKMSILYRKQSRYWTGLTAVWCPWTSSSWSSLTSTVSHLARRLCLLPSSYKLSTLFCFETIPGKHYWLKPKSVDCYIQLGVLQAGCQVWQNEWQSQTWHNSSYMQWIFFYSQTERRQSLLYKSEKEDYDLWNLVICTERWMQLWKDKNCYMKGLYFVLKGVFCTQSMTFGSNVVWWV